MRILRLLLATPGCIGGDIVDAVSLAQSTVSKHLRILKAMRTISAVPRTLKRLMSATRMWYRIRCVHHARPS